MIKISYLLDNEDWSDEQFENQEERGITLSEHDIVDMIKYGRINNYPGIPEGCWVNEILSIEK